MQNEFMAIAIEQAKLAGAHDEVPVGAAVFRNGELVACAHNESIMRNNPCSHAEMLVIERAFKKLGAYRLDDCDLYVTLEPCSMCAGAILLARFKRVYFGAYDSRDGAFGGLFDIAKEKKSKIEIYGGICEKECSKILTEFFSKKA